jgi:hypothetical protein
VLVRLADAEARRSAIAEGRARAAEAPRVGERLAAFGELYRRALAGERGDTRGPVRRPHAATAPEPRRARAERPL